MRVALYARYSDDRQNERSIADQVAVLSRHAATKGWTIAAIFSDAAISGAAMANRPGLLNAVDAAERGEFEILLCEDEDRMARNLEHTAHVFNRLRHHGVAIATLASDRIGIMEVGLKGVMAEMYLANLSQKTKRGMHSNAEKGLATGSRLYGYRTEPGGATTIVEAEAAIIRRIVADYAAGDTPRQIASALNAEGLPGPRGGRWNASSINGSRQRANGILHTDLYGGVKTWNRMEVLKDPVSGKRTPRIKPEAEWRSTPVPHLRIVEPGVWAAVRARKDAERGASPVSLRRRPGPFSGLLRCGLCGGSYTAYSGGKLVCATHREQGDAACINRRTPNRGDIERRALEGIRTQLLSPEAVSAYVREFHAAAHARKVDLTSRRQPLERRLGELKRAIERVVDKICDGTSTPALEARMQAMDVERQAVEAQLAEADAEQLPVLLHPNAGEQFIAIVAELETWLGVAALGETRAQRELIAILRSLIVKIEIIPLSQERYGAIDLVLHGNLAMLLSGAQEPNGNAGWSKVVAGGGAVRWQPGFVATTARVRL